MLPAAGQWCNHTFGLQIDYRNDLHSYGLIIVSLLANYFWKPRLVRGTTTSIITVALTYALVKYVVLRFTNLNLGSLHYLYEDVSTSLLSSPKAYIVVITTAYLASWLNLKYSWDFNGSFLSPHCWRRCGTNRARSPSRWVSHCGSWHWRPSLDLRLPIWGQVTVEGGRKLLLFFTITAIHRLALAHLLPRLGDFYVTDAFGFGYLLTTLIAVKSHDKKITVRVCRGDHPGLDDGGRVGECVGVLAIASAVQLCESPNSARYRARRLGDSCRAGFALEDCHVQRVRLYGMRVPESYQVPMQSEKDAFRDGLQSLLRYLKKAGTITTCRRLSIP